MLAFEKQKGQARRQHVWACKCAVQQQSQQQHALEHQLPKLGLHKGKKRKQGFMQLSTRPSSRVYHAIEYL